MKRMQVPAIVEGISTLKDGGLSIRFHTNEVNDEEKLIIMGFYQKFGWLLFSEQEHENDLDLESIRKDVGGKSPSQRLRSVIYVLYRQQNILDITFEQYYVQKIEMFINHIKDNLNDIPF